MADFAMHAWILAVAALCALPCALLGCFLVLRRTSLLGDAISHAILPGLALGFLLSHSRDLAPMLAGALAAALLAALLIQLLVRVGRLDSQTAMGVVFSSLFALGVILIKNDALRHVDIDADCVLYGALELTWLNTVPLLGHDVPRAALVLGAVAVGVALMVVLLYKELKITSFDPQLARTLGIPAAGLDYLLMAATAVTCVACFESVGSILVVALLILPAAIAHLLTDRLSGMLVLAAVIGVLAGALGYLLALPTDAGGLWWLDDAGTSAAGMIAVVLGAAFLLAVLFAPRHGLVSKVLAQARLGLRIGQEDVLGALYRRQERAGADVQAWVPLAEVATAAGSPAATRLALRLLSLRGAVQRTAAEGGQVRLTAVGLNWAQTVVRRHRLWEDYLVARAGLPADHVHPLSSRLEHVRSPDVQAGLARAVGAATHDPHGRAIPPPADATQNVT